MESSDPQQNKVDFYEAEYDKAYEKKSSFTTYNPTIAGFLLMIPGLILYLFMMYGAILEYSGWWDILFFLIFSIIEVPIIYAGYCAIKKQKHRFTLLGAILSFIIPINYSFIITGLAFVIGFNYSIVIIGLLVFHPIVIIFLLLTSDDEFTS